MAFDIKMFLVGLLLFSAVILTGIASVTFLGQSYSTTDTASANSTFASITNISRNTITEMNDTSNKMAVNMRDNQITTLGIVNDMFTGAYATLKLAFNGLKIVTLVIFDIAVVLPISLVIQWPIIAIGIFTIVLTITIVMIIFNKSR